MSKRFLSTLIVAFSITACSESPPISQDPALTSPVIVFQSGLGDGREVWNPVINALANQYPVFAYDRPGYGSAPNNAAPRDPCATATALHSLLQQRGLKPPYLIVGHSLGGLYQFAFAQLYPSETSCMVLLDPTHPLRWEKIQAEIPDVATAINTARQSFSPAMTAEFDQQAVCSDRLLAHSSSIPVKLMVPGVLPPDEQGAYLALEIRLQQEWQTLTMASEIEKVQGAGHYIQKDAPTAVADAIRSLAQ